jgi:hypothetical protein
VGVQGEDVVERDGQEGEVEDHGGRFCCLWSRLCVLRELVSWSWFGVGFNGWHMWKALILELSP